MFFNFLRRAANNFRENNFKTNSIETETATEAETQEQTILKESIYGKISIYIIC